MSEISRHSCDSCGGNNSVAKYDNGNMWCHKCSTMVKKVASGPYIEKVISKEDQDALRKKFFDKCGLPGAITTYLYNKGIKDHIGPARPLKGALVVPVINKAGKFESLQFIQADGSKKFLKDGKVGDNYCVITEHCAFVHKPSTDIVFVVEGYATGISVYQMFGKDVIVAFNAGNLKKVVKHFPKTKLIIVADNDTKSQTGIIKAREAQIGNQNVHVIMDDDAGDANDIVNKYGLDVAKQRYTQKLSELI